MARARMQDSAASWLLEARELIVAGYCLGTRFKSANSKHAFVILRASACGTTRAASGSAMWDRVAGHGHRVDGLNFGKS
eukprot:6183973-Pleurochrysis_carterae.AAC.2